MLCKLTALITASDVSQNDEVKERTMGDYTKRKGVEVVAIDLAKKSFQLHGADKSGRQMLIKKLSRQKLKEFMVNLPPCLVAMEACGSAHYWGRLFRSYGHEVKLIAPQFVKPYVKSNKNDAADAEAICEAVLRPNMRFVAIKEAEQQDIQAIHRMRSLVLGRRTAQVNQIRGLLLEYGIEIPKGRAKVTKHLPLILEDAENGLSDFFREELFQLGQELKHLDARVSHYDEKIKQLARGDARIQRLITIPGIGAQTATALLAAVGNADVFKNGREMAAWLGLVPKQYSTGGKSVLRGISKRGDVYLRQLLIHGARSVLNVVSRKEDRTSRWADAIQTRRHKNIAAVALANKTARTAFALLRKGEAYRAPGMTLTT
jgi:transposase